MALTDADMMERTAQGSKSRVEDRTRWSVTHLYRAGLLTKIARGTYEASERGRKVLAAPPARISLTYLAQWPEYAEFRRRSSDGESNGSGADQALPSTTVVSLPTAETPRERLEAAEKEIRAALIAELLERMRALEPDAFEQLIVDLLVKMGYGGSRSEAAQRLGRSGDGGIDGIIREDALGLDAVYIQAKRYGEDNPIGAPLIQGFAGALLGNGATKGVFVTTSRFTPAARNAAEGYRTHRIILIDGVELARLMIQHEVGVRTVQTVRIQRVDLDTYENDDA